MSEALVFQTVSALTLCLFLAVCAYVSTRTYNLQVLVIRHKIRGTTRTEQEYKVFSSRYNPVFFFVIVLFLYYMIAQFVRSMFGVEFQLSAKIALFPSAMFLILGWAFGMAINGSRRFKAMMLAEEIYTRGYGEVEEEYEIGYKFKTGFRIKQVPVDELIIVADEGSENLTKFMANSCRERKTNYPILLDPNAHTS
ncbi:hypothetical protein FWF89_03210 [Candidatus Saccharibacteria bacterium]|nr:hypothetical protein [Candidatus Saccharibacteria bacterium]